MKIIHLALATNNLVTSIADYSKRLGAKPCVNIPNEYALPETKWSEQRRLICQSAKIIMLKKKSLGTLALKTQQQKPSPQPKMPMA